MVYPHLMKRDEGRYTRTVPHLLAKPKVWTSIPIFALVYMRGWWLAFKTAKANLSTWNEATVARPAGHDVTIFDTSAA